MEGVVLTPGSSERQAAASCSGCSPGTEQSVRTRLGIHDGATLVCPQARLYVSKSAQQFAWGGDKSYLRDLIKFLIYTPINSPGLLAMCLKLYLPKDSLLSIDQGPGSHKLWEHACG